MFLLHLLEYLFQKNIGLESWFLSCRMKSVGSHKWRAMTYSFLNQYNLGWEQLLISKIITCMHVIYKIILYLLACMSVLNKYKKCSFKYFFHICSPQIWISNYISSPNKLILHLFLSSLFMYAYLNLSWHISLC